MIVSDKILQNIIEEKVNKKHPTIWNLAFLPRNIYIDLYGKCMYLYGKCMYLFLHYLMKFSIPTEKNRCNLKVKSYVLFSKHSKDFMPRRQDTQITVRGCSKDARG